MVVQADDIARPGLFHVGAVRRHEGQGVRNLDILVDTHVAHLHVLFVLAGANTQEGDAVTVFRVHVGLDLEHEAGEALIVGRDFAGIGIARLGRRGIFDEAVEHLAHAEVAHGGTEVDRRQLTATIGLEIELVRGAAHQLDFHAQLFDQVFAQHFDGFGAVEALDAHVIGDAVALALLVEMDLVIEQVIDALEALADADRPGHRRTLDVEHRLDFVHHLDGVTRLAVHLVDKGQDRRGAQAADFHQLDGAVLDTLGAIDDHQRRVDGRQRPVGIFGEVLVPGGIQQVDHAALVRELHHGSGHGDATLLLHLHPVRGRVAIGPLALDRAGHLDGIPEQQ